MNERDLSASYRARLVRVRAHLGGGLRLLPLLALNVFSFRVPSALRIELTHNRRTPTPAGRIVADTPPSPDAATKLIHVGMNVQVSVAHPDRPHYEVLVAADPSNARNLVACSIVTSSDTYLHKTVAYVSHDGGTTWRATLEVAPGRSFWRDPACTFGPSGEAYFIGFGGGLLQRGDSFAGLFDKGYLYRSIDGGDHWLARVDVPVGDRPFITVDHTQGPYRGRVYVHGSDFVPVSDGGHAMSVPTLTYSTDGGATFPKGPAVLPSLGERYVIAPGNSVVLDDGTLVWIFGELKHYWSEGSEQTVEANQPDHANARLRIVTCRDRDGYGVASLASPVTVSDYYLVWPPGNVAGVPTLAVDESGGPYRGRLYAAWIDERFGRAQIFLAFSKDGGSTWSPPQIVNDDRPWGGGRRGPDHSQPVVAVNRYGVVGVSWYDRRAHPDDIGWDVRFAASLDGGESFLPSVRVSEAPYVRDTTREWWLDQNGVFYDPAHRDRVRGQLWLGPFSLNGGDTGGLAADADGVFHPVWVDNRTGTAQLWTAAVDVRQRSVRNGDAELETLEDVTSDLLLELSSPRYNPLTHRVGVNAVLINTSRTTVRGPIRFKLTELTSVAGTPEVRNADNGRFRAGAVWAFAAGKNDGLAPGGTTTPRRLEFELFGVDESTFGRRSPTLAIAGKVFAPGK